MHRSIHWWYSPWLFASFSNRRFRRATCSGLAGKQTYSMAFSQIAHWHEAPCPGRNQSALPSISTGQIWMSEHCHQCRRWMSSLACNDRLVRKRIHFVHHYNPSSRTTHQHCQVGDLQDGGRKWKDIHSTANTIVQTVGYARAKIRGNHGPKSGLAPATWYGIWKGRRATVDAGEVRVKKSEEGGERGEKSKFTMVWKGKTMKVRNYASG